MIMCIDDLNYINDLEKASYGAVDPKLSRGRI